MDMEDNSARLVGKLMGSLNATDEDAIAVGLTLGTEENAQRFFQWCRSLTEDPTPQECFEKAVEIRMTWGPDPEEEPQASPES